MRLLLCLAEQAGEVVSIDTLLDQVWPEVTVSQDSVYQAVTSLRRLLGDDPKQPTYIATVPRLGYRMVAKVSPWPDQAIAQTVPSQISTGDNPSAATTDPTIVAPTHSRPPRLTSRVLLAGVAALCLAILVVFVFRGKIANNNYPSSADAIASQPEKSIAVLPFLDLTEKMSNEPFADGMTEELIDKLSKIPSLMVSPATSSFYFKGKQIPIADIAKTLHVVYVLDGSVRKSGSRIRVAARLTRAGDGYVEWTETYDRALGDILMVQDDIAGEVTKALKASIDANPDHHKSP